MLVTERNSQGHTWTNIEEIWALFDQIRMVKMKIVDLDAKQNINI